MHDVVYILLNFKTANTIVTLTVHSNIDDCNSVCYNLQNCPINLLTTKPIVFYQHYQAMYCVQLLLGAPAWKFRGVASYKYHID